MQKLKVMTLVGTRPEIIRLSAVIRRLDREEAIEHIFVHTGQNYDYELNEVFFADFALRKPDYFLNVAGENASTTIGNILIATDKVISETKPDVFLVLGDTNSALAAIVAKRHKVPVFHMEAGNRCFDQRVPEEINRKIVDHIADINMPYSTIAREHLLNEGLPADQIIKTGSPMKEVLLYNEAKIKESDILKRLNVEPGNFFLVSAHREENIESGNFFKLVEVLNHLAEVYKVPIIISTHPRTRKKIITEGVNFHPLIVALKPLGFNDYIKLQTAAKAVLSDSGTISEEASILNFKALNIREAHERPEAYEEGAVMLVGLSKERIMQALDVLLKSEMDIRTPRDYDVTNVSDKVLKIIIGYTDYVNRKVWQKG